MVHYHTTAKSNILPLNNSGTPIIVLLSIDFAFLHFNHDLRIYCSLLA